MKAIGKDEKLYPSGSQKKKSTFSQLPKNPYRHS